MRMNLVAIVPPGAPSKVGGCKIYFIGSDRLYYVDSGSDATPLPAFSTLEAALVAARIAAKANASAR